ncbi:DUF3618 domain-containing protein [Nocardioides sp. 616]|uniref:DUF3618 domain-containing protein n=1 Tax=Nocardioides sp. 616 TaxID=2268090 RepID=UPI000CE3A553|nr:DUF3618 domain-containing protein [Nocardioides sp. 616]
MSDHKDPADIEADIERQRQALAQTLDELGTKLDVKRQFKERVQPVPLAAVGAVVVAVMAIAWWRSRR